MLKFAAEGLIESARLMQKTAGMMQRAGNSALATIGFHLKQQATKATRENRFGWAPLAPATHVLAKLDRRRGRRKPWQWLHRFAAYVVDRERQVVDFGFWRVDHPGRKARIRRLDQRGLDMVTRLSEGWSRTVTPRMQRFLAVRGIKRRIGSVIHAPPRPLIRPVFEQEQAKLPAIFREKFFERFEKYKREAAK